MATTSSVDAPTLADDQHTWDGFPHRVWDNMPVTAVRLADIIGSVWQVQGVGLSEHRGKPAVRFDVENVAFGGKGRIILSRDQVIMNVKRYDGDPTESLASHPTADEYAEQIALTRSPVPADRARAKATAFDWLEAARQWAEATDGVEAYDDADAMLFAMLCSGVQAYSADDKSAFTAAHARENAYTLASILANIAPGYTITDDTVVTAPSGD